MILPVIQDRRSVRDFAPKEVPEELIQELIRAAQIAPTGMNNRAVEFLVLRSREAKEKLFALLEPKQPFIKEAPVVIIPATDTRKIPVLGLNQTIIAVSDLAIASAFIMAQAVALGLGTVWKHVMAEIAPKVVKAFGLPPEFFLTNVIPVGYPAKKLPPHQESEFSAAKIHREQW
jgi:nitroreductase